jgi:hypothetical protein
LGKCLTLAVWLGIGTASLALAQTTKPIPPCTPRTAPGTACTPFLGGSLNLGDPGVTDTLVGSVSGAVTNYSLAGDGTVWNIAFSYSPGDPIRDTGVGFLIYDSNWNVVTLQNATGDPPHSQRFMLPTVAGATYQVQVFNYMPVTISYTIGVSQGH